MDISLWKFKTLGKLKSLPILLKEILKGEAVDPNTSAEAKQNLKKQLFKYLDKGIFQIKKILNNTR